jgi:hypothetical protein
MNDLDESMSAHRANIAAIRRDRLGSENHARVEKLPAWARSYLERLEGEVHSLSRMVADGPEGSDTFVQGYSHPDRPIGVRPNILYRLDPDRVLDCYVEVSINRERGDEPGVYVRGDSTLVISPASGNAIRVTTESMRDQSARKRK